METSGLLSLFRTMPERDGEPFFALRDAYRCRRTPYRQVHEDALRFASLLGERSVGGGDRVVLCGPNSPLWVSCFIGCLRAGAVVVPLDAGSSPDFAVRVLERSGATFAVTTPSLAGAIRTETTLVFDRLPGLLKQREPSRTPAVIRADDLAEIIFTSGTTAEPKGVKLTHGNISAHFDAYADVLGDFGPWMKRLGISRFLGLLPLSHMFGQVLQVFIPLMMGAPVTFLEKPTTAGILDSARLDGSNMMVATPRFLSFLRDHVLRAMRERGKEESFQKRFERCPRMHWTMRILLFLDVHRIFSFKLWVFLVGGARLEPELEEFWRRLGFSVWQGYGLTEAAPVITFNNPFRGAVGSIGRVVGKQEFKLADDGEILVRGPNVMPGYLGSDAGRGGASEDGWLHTGDLGRRDDEGNIFFTGRKKDLIVLPDGRNVHPGDVESVLRETAGIRDAVVLGIEREGSALIHGVILPQEGANADEAVADANRRLEVHQRLKRYSIWPESDFPRTPTGKVRRGVVRKYIESATAGEAPAAGETSRLLEALARVGLKAPGSAGRQARLGVELGMSSLDRVELATILEDEFQIEVDDSMLEGEMTIGGLEERLSTRGERTAPGITIHRYPRSLLFRSLRECFRTTLLSLIIRTFCRLTVTGKENLADADPPLIFIANHTSHLDAPVVAVSLPARFARRLAPAMSAEQFPLYFDRERPPGLRKFLQGLGYHSLIIPFNAYPIPPHGSGRRSLKYTGELLDAGWCPLVFPEGSRSPDGRMRRFREGVGLTALEMGASVVPIRIGGLHRVLPRGAFWPKRGPVRVSIGRPAVYPEGDREAVTKKLEEMVRILGKGGA